MTVTLESTIKRYIGLSTDEKPVGDFANGEVLPVGSSFLETDTSRIYRWTGQLWVSADLIDEQATLLNAMFQELYAMRTMLEGFLSNQQ